MSTPKDWDILLDDIAVQIDELLLEPGAIDTFRERIRAFKERWEQHNAEVDRYEKGRVAHWERVKDEPRLRDKAAGPPKEGWEWDKGYYLAGLSTHDGGPEYEIPAKYVPDLMTAVKTAMEQNTAEMARYAESSHEYGRLAEAIQILKQDLVELHREFDQLIPAEKVTGWISAPCRIARTPNKVVEDFLWWHWLDITEEDVFGCWRPPLKRSTEHPCEILIPEEGTRRLPQPCDKAEEYERYYVSLASIHDNVLSGSESITKAVWPAELAEEVWFRFSRAQPWGPDRAFIKTALKRIRGELAQRLDRQERRTSSGRIFSGGVKDEFIRAAEAFPKLAYVYMEWDAQGSAPEGPADFRFDASDPSRNTPLETPHGRGDARASLSWLCRPPDKDWQIENARDRLRQLILRFFNADSESRWLFNLRDALAPRKCRLYTTEDFGKREPFRIGRRACRRAKPGEAFFQVVEDLFQECAMACETRAFAEAALSRLNPDLEKRSQKPNRLGASGEATEGRQTCSPASISGRMSEQEIQQVRQYAARVAGLLEPMAMPSLERTWESEPPGAGGTNEDAERIDAEWEKALHPLKVEYRERVVAVLGDSCWEPIADIFEHFTPETLGRLDAWRQDILDHTDPARDRHMYWLQSCGEGHGQYGPNSDLKNRLENLIGKLRRRADRAEEALSQARATVRQSNQRLGELDIQGLIERLKTLRSALDSAGQGLVGRARDDLKAYVGSAEQLYDALQEPLRGSTADAMERLGWVGEARKSRTNTGLYPALLDALATPEFIAELDRWWVEFAANHPIRDIATDREGLSGQKQTEPGQPSRRTALDEPLSKPMSKSRIMQALGIDGRKRFDAWADGKLIQIGKNRQLWQVRLNCCAPNERDKLEKV